LSATLPNISRPNILLCVFDSLAAVDGSSLHARPATPALDKFRRQSFEFSMAYATSPESSPARASLFTGLDPAVHGVWTNGVSLPLHELTFPQLLKQTGYTNWLVGRRQLAGVSNWTTEHCRADEFDQFEWAHGPLHRSRQNAYLHWLQETAPERYTKIFPLQADPDNTTIPPEQFDAIATLPDELSFNYWVGLRACELMSSANNPFLGLISFSVGALMGTEPTQGHNSEALNTQALKQADAALERVLTHLSEQSLSKDTVVVVTAARGNTPSTNIESTDSADVKISVDSAMHECAIKVPLMVRVPDQTPQVIGAPVSTIDVAPTILELAGVPLRSRMQGTSLIAMLNGSEPFRNWAISRLRAGELTEPDQLNTQRQWQTALRANNMKLIVHHGNLQSGKSISYQLFDLVNDPHEKNDLSAQKNHATDLENMIDIMIDARCALEDRTEPRIAKF